MKTDDGVMWLDDPPAGRSLTQEEMRAANRQARLDAKPTPRAKQRATRAKLSTLVRRDLMRQLRERLRLERLERLAKTTRRSAPPPTKARVVVTTEERAAKQRERDRVREEKRTARREAARLKRLGLPPLPYAAAPAAVPPLPYAPAPVESEIIWIDE